ncbi:MAG: MOSC domain-containing protein [Alphaproteobacteria bacterium]
MTSEKGAPMKAMPEVTAIADRGLEGDRYLRRAGYWTDVDECHVTLIEAEHLDEIERETSVKVQNGEHRRNIVTRNIDLLGLDGRRFKVGAATLVFDRPRPPCAYLASITDRRMTKALWNRGGICARVVEGGTIKPGDRITVL